MEFAQKVFLVTGGSRGLGKAIVKKLAAQGATVVFTYHSNITAAQEVIEELSEGQDEGGTVVAIQSDVSNCDAAQEAIDKVVNLFGRLDGLVNNAGITQDSPFYKMTNEKWTSVIDTNLNGVFYLTRAYLQKAIRSGGGKIVNMSSVSGIKGLKGQANYCASKGGLIALTKSLAIEYARFNIQINAVAPGYIATEMVESLGESIKKKISKSIPLQRLGCPNEVANLTSFLLSQQCNYMTGQTLTIDGGLTA